MSNSMQCVRCSSTFSVQPAASGRIACPHCGAMLPAAENGKEPTQPTPARTRPPLTDDQVLEFLGPAPRAEAKAARPGTKR